MPSRIKDSALSQDISDDELSWLDFLCPVTHSYYLQTAKKNFRGKTVACWQHITLSSIPLFMGLKKAGAEVFLGNCNTQTTDDRVAAYLAKNGIHVFARSGMTEDEHKQSFRSVGDSRACYLSDMGGELINAFSKKQIPVKGALEATTSGLHFLDNKEVSFPVFNWNDIALKNNLHNQVHVGDNLWPKFSFVTGMSLPLRRIAVIGFGPVGRGVAERAKAFGAKVLVIEKDPVRELEAGHLGFEVASDVGALRSCEIVVTATGVPSILSQTALRDLRDHCVVLNVGHLNSEIDVTWLDTNPSKEIRTNITRYKLGTKTLYLLGRGCPLNIAPHTGPQGVDLFDFYNAVMLRGITWMMESDLGKYKSGLQIFPKEIEEEIASEILRLRVLT